VRFICGTQDLHKTLEQRLARFLGTEDAILYAAAFDANGGLFEPLLGEQDAIISDALNHASIIDGIRLCKAERRRYPQRHGRPGALPAGGAGKGGARHTLVFTDGVFSMDGTVAQLDVMRSSATEYGALLGHRRMPCHRLHGRHGPRHARAPGFAACSGRSTSSPARWARRWAARRVASPRGRRRWSSCCASARGPICSATPWRPASRAPRIAVLDLLEADTGCATSWRTTRATSAPAIAAAGFDIKPGDHPIVPIMVYDAVLAQQLSRACWNWASTWWASSSRWCPRAGAHPGADERGARAGQPPGARARGCLSCRPAVNWGC
jgi:glycine C-acetyltransferase